MSKHYNIQNFDLGNDSIHCYTTETRTGFCHHAEYLRNGWEEIARKRVSYINRTWEQFKYETCIQELAEKLPKADRLAVEAFCVTHAKHVAEDCEKWIEGFRSVLGKLNDKQRDTLAKTVGHIETEADANTAMMMAAIMAVAS